MQESRNNIENTLKGKMKDSQEDVAILEKKAKVRFDLSLLCDSSAVRADSRIGLLLACSTSTTK